MRIILEKADSDGYEFSDLEIEILRNLKVSRLANQSAEFGGLEVHNPQNLPELYLSSSDYDRIYKNTIGDVLANI